VLVDLHLRNLAVLAGASVEFGPGLNVLTGETGAGKSIVVDSLSLLGGARAASDLVRAGAEQLAVTGVFRLQGPGAAAVAALLAGAGVEADGGEVVVRREIGREGRNRVFLNDQPVTLRLLAELAPQLLRIHGQREELGLAVPDLQRAWLDRSGGEEAAGLLAAVERTHGLWSALATRLERLRGDARLRSERLDLLRFQLAEIDRVRPHAGEEDELRRERDLLRHRETIERGLGEALELLVDGEGAAGDRVAAARERLADVAVWEPRVEEACRQLAELSTGFAELARDLRACLPSSDEEPGRLDAVEERLAALERLLRRHGGTTGELLAARARIAEELAELEHDESHRDELEGDLSAALADYRHAALALSAARERWGAGLSARLAEELGDLALERARLAVGLERRPRAGSPLELDGRAVEFGATGVDAVIFLFSPNPGEEPRPLGRIASGGELSRVFLALQLAARGETESGGPALVFDEVDAGIGGAAAAAVGRKLQRLATSGQILAVTHLPQVACHADRHFKVEKRVEAGRTFAEVRELAPDERVEEVARMLGGAEITRRTRSAAAEMLEAARRPRA
jgi:DNA repair protein RecN (Recombination protein N)